MLADRPSHQQLLELTASGQHELLARVWRWLLVGRCGSSDRRSVCSVGHQLAEGCRGAAARAHLSQWLDHLLQITLISVTKRVGRPNGARTNVPTQGKAETTALEGPLRRVYGLVGLELLGNFATLSRLPPSRHNLRQLRQYQPIALRPRLPSRWALV